MQSINPVKPPTDSPGSSPESLRFSPAMADIYLMVVKHAKRTASASCDLPRRDDMIGEYR
jgi:hypothetical protein